MRNKTRDIFNQYLKRVGELNGIDDTSKKFAATPSVQQTLENKIQDSSDFLSRINIVPVDEQQGEKLGLGVGSTLASTTDTNANDRETQSPTNIDDTGYLCTQTNFDTHLNYALLDMWAKFPDFQQRIRDAIIKRTALDRQTIGWNGTSRAANSDRATNPLLQDVNIGWLQKVRAAASANIMTEGSTAGQVRIGDGGDYQNLDAAVFDAVNNLLASWYQDDTELVCVMGRELLADKYFPLIQQYDQPTEGHALDIMISAKRVGGIQAARVPGFPPRSLAITRLDNLSIYYQDGSRRRTIVENAKRDRIEDYNSVNEAYVVEDYDGFGGVENIVLPDGNGGWA